MRVLFLFSSAIAFISTWRTDYVNQSITLPFTNPVNLTVYWGDGSVQNFTNAGHGAINHVYENVSNYTISIPDTVFGWSFGSACMSCDNLIEISEWGDFRVGTYEWGVFRRCNFLTVTAVDQPRPDGGSGSLETFFYACPLLNLSVNWDLTGFSNLDYMFQNARGFNSPINFSNSTSVTQMRNIFEGASQFNSSFTMDASGVTAMEFMFLDATSFNQPIDLDISAALTLDNMFCNATSFNSPVTLRNAGRVKSLSCLFCNATSFNQSVNISGLSGALFSIDSMFANATSFNHPQILLNTTSVVNMSHMFDGAVSFNQVLNLETRNVSDMSYMFAGARAFNSSLNFTNTSNVNNMTFMFARAQSFNCALNLDMRNALNTSHMFDGASSFNQPVQLDPYRSEDMSFMFAGASAFNGALGIPVNSGVNVLSMSSMFDGATSFNQPVNFSSATNVVDYSRMFAGATSFNSSLVLTSRMNSNFSQMFAGAVSFDQPLRLAVRHTRDVSYMFDGATSFNSFLDFYDLDYDYDYLRLRDLEGMFRDAKQFNQPVDLNLRHTRNLASMFDGAQHFNQTVNFSSAGRVEDYSRMFAGATNFNSPVVLASSSNRNFSQMFALAVNFDQPLQFSVRSAQDMSYMFDGATSFNSSLEFDDSPDYSYDQDLTGMFRGATSFNQVVDLNMSKAQKFASMFEGATNFNQFVNFSFAAHANELSRMFAGATSFNSPVILPSSNNSDFSQMFAGATSFNQPLSFDTTNALSMADMFSGAVEFDSLVSFTGTTANVEDMSGMFRGAIKYNQPIMFSQTSNVNAMNSMFEGATRFNQVLPFLANTGNVQNMSRMFFRATAFNRTLAGLNISSVVDMSGMFALVNASASLGVSNWSVGQVERCGGFCSDCSLPAFPMCSPCLSPQTIKRSATGGNVCNCPSSQRTVTPSQCGVLDPSCPSCVAVVNHSGVVALGNVSVTVPESLVSSNMTLRIVVVPFPNNSSISSQFVPGGTLIVSIVLQVDGVDQPGTVNLSSPISFVVPHTKVLSELTAGECGASLTGRCVWWDGSAWVDSGCVSNSAATPEGTTCTCDHLTDFAVLLRRISSPCEDKFYEVYYPFVAFYCLIMLYCLVTAARLLYAPKNPKVPYKYLLVNHALMGFVALLRLLSCLQFLDTLGDNVGARVFFTAFPYLFEYLLFTRLAATWIGLVHFSMMQGEAQWVQVRPVFIVANCIGAVCVLAVFVAFAIDRSEAAAIAGTVVLASFHLFLALVFHVYAAKVAAALKHGPGSSANSSSSSSSASSASLSNTLKQSMSCGIADKLQWVGRSVTYCFVVQALCGIVGEAVPSQLAGWTGMFLTCNVLALCALAAVFYAGVQRTLSQPSASASSASSRKRSMELT